MRNDELNQLRDLVRYEPEGTTLDFKSEQYDKNSKRSLIEDVLAMANAHAEGPRRIIFGVDKRSDGKPVIVGLQREGVRDAAEIQQTVHANITPDLQVEYEPFEADCGALLCVLTIRESPNRPYMISKEVAGLRPGFMHIRKGQKASPCWPEDIQRMAKSASQPQDADMVIQWAGGTTELLLAALPGSHQLPSEKAEARIRAEQNRRKLRPASTAAAASPMAKLAAFGSPFAPRPLSSMTDDELENILASTSKSYVHEDNYFLFETMSDKVNLDIHWNGSSYLQDVLIELIMPQIPEVWVADRVINPPRDNSYFMRANVSLPSIKLGYPNVEYDGDTIRVARTREQVRHGMTTPAFDIPIRVVAHAESGGSEFKTQVRLHASNLPVAIERELTIKINQADES